MEKEVLETVDKTIKSVCEKIQKEDFVPGEYGDTVKALASLVEARASLN